ncbi:MAG: LysE family transporter [Rheinheimera sp.]|jgi:threonine/homoserine/homoserine lactone efflux protein|nr:LysE family transporter [Rheinheimera sp.]
MDAIWSVLAISAALAVGAVSPGPSFIVVARNAMSLSRQHGLATACGMGLGAGTFALLALLGLHAVFTAFPMAFLVLKVAGGMYLLYIASLIIRHATAPLQMQSAADGTGLAVTKLQAFRHGLLTQLSNPKTAIVFASVFSALLPAQIPFWFYFVLPLAAMLIDGGWYILVAYLLSAEAPRQTYLKFKTAIDRAAGTVMALLGLKLVFAAFI